MPFVNTSKSASPSWANPSKTYRAFGDFTLEEQNQVIGSRSLEDNLPGTVPPTTVGNATLETPVFTIFQNNAKSSAPTFTNTSKS